MRDFLKSSSFKVLIITVVVLLGSSWRNSRIPSRKTNR